MKIRNKLEWQPLMFMKLQVVYVYSNCKMVASNSVSNELRMFISDNEGTICTVHTARNAAAAEALTGVAHGGATRWQGEAKVAKSLKR